MRVVVLRSGWMVWYAGDQPDDQPVGGGSYNKENLGHERFNFKMVNGRVYGTFQASGEGMGGLNIARIDPNSHDAPSLGDVLVVFIAKHPTEGGQRVVGWYRHATVHSRRLPDRGPERANCGYQVECDAADAVLLPVEQRTWEVPTDKGGMRQTHVRYPYTQSGELELPDWLERIVNQIESYEGSNLLTTKNGGGATNGGGDQVKVRHPLCSVLYGPPGTGKTYLAMERAVEICDGVPAKDREAAMERFRQLCAAGRVEVVTFHQSYSYEEFVEGIRPVLDENEGDGEPSGKLRYEVKDGVFKVLCRAAEAPPPAAGQRVDLTDVSFWKMSLGNTGDPDDNAIYEQSLADSSLLLGWGRDTDYTGCDDSAAILAKVRTLRSDAAPTDMDVSAVQNFKNTMRKGDIVIVSDGNHKFRAIAQVTGDYEFSDGTGVRYRQRRPVRWLATYAKSLSTDRITSKAFSQRTLHRLKREDLKLDALAALIGQAPTTAGRQPSVQRFVMVIDEINRGNISKILGELITLLEEDKRIGARNQLRVQLPYSREDFGVPPNVYVLGTMNTADRSIALLDTALRRRFEFEELMPDSDVVRATCGNRGNVEGVDVAAMLDAINRRIELLFDRDHQIGHAYFAGVTTLEELRHRFRRKVVPLLQEYFYGDWTKVARVLGCPFDPVSGRTSNGHPVLRASPLVAREILGDDADHDDRARCEINPDFLSSDANALVPFFRGVGG